MGDKFYIICKGSVDVYVPFEKRVDLSTLELAKLIEGFGDMLISINGITNFSTPYLTKTEKAKLASITFESIMQKISELTIAEGK